MATSHLKGKKVLLRDTGNFLHWAFELARLEAEVYVYCEWKSQCPRTSELGIADGFKDLGVVRVRDLWRCVPNMDLVIYADVYNGDEAEHIQALGIPVWSAFSGEDLELYRWAAKQLFVERGIATTEAVQITGMDNLCKYLKDHDNQVVKISTVRGDGETWVHKKYRTSELKLDKIEARLGRNALVAKFMVEEKVDAIEELGYDGYNILGQFAQVAMLGLEDKDKGLLGVVKKYDELPPQILDINEKLAPVYKQCGYKGFVSSEARFVREAGKIVGKFIDSTNRCACPGGESYRLNYTNWDEIFLAGAEGVLVEPVPDKLFTLQAVITSGEAEDDEGTYELYFPEEIRANLNIFNWARVKGVDVFLPQKGLRHCEIGYIVVNGNTVAAARKELERIAKIFEAGTFDAQVELDSVDRMLKEIAKGELAGIHFSDKLGPLET